MSIYKKFTAQDYATIPFNAHKQYNFDNFSAASSSVNYFATSWTSESIDFYSAPGSGSEPNTDRINTIKYNQIDHLFYKNFKTDSTHRFGKFNYLKQRRTLYEKANIISIPTGLYGHEIKPSSFYMEGQDTQVQGSAIKLLDDTEGNLIISGTNVNNYPTDVRSNIFNLGPIKGFKAYDLRIFSNYAQVLRDPQGNPWESTKLFYRQGEIDPNIRLDSTYKTPELQIDDSYFFNHLKYINVNFQTSSLGSSVCQFPTIKFDSKVGSHIVSPDSEQFDFNPGDDFAVSFQIKVNRPAINPVIGQQYGGGKIFHYDELNEEVYIVHDKVLDNFVGGVPTANWDGSQTNTNRGKFH